MNQLRETLSQYWVRLEEYLSTPYGLPGRPLADRRAIARAFVAKMVYTLPTTMVLIDRLKSDPQLRRLCGWERKSAIPGEWTFSRAFAEFAESRLSERVYEALIHKHYAGKIPPASTGT